MIETERMTLERRMKEISDLINTASLKEDTVERYAGFREAELQIELLKIGVFYKFIQEFAKKKMSFHG
jgi:hypothetical protein